LAELREVPPEIIYDELWERRREDPKGFVAGWKNAADAQGFIHQARQRLRQLTRLQRRSGRADTPAWQEIQSALDGQHDLLRAALAMEQLELIEPAVLRATHLREGVVATPCSEQANRFLDEATRSATSWDCYSPAR
jgi:hypothetical protein